MQWWAWVVVVLVVIAVSMSGFIALQSRRRRGGVIVDANRDPGRTAGRRDGGGP
jgi:hypothetical protein